MLTLLHFHLGSAAASEASHLLGTECSTLWRTGGHIPLRELSLHYG